MLAITLNLEQLNAFCLAPPINSTITQPHNVFCVATAVLHAQDPVLIATHVGFHLFWVSIYIYLQHFLNALCTARKGIGPTAPHINAKVVQMDAQLVLEAPI